jgi:hypothetical protein
VPRVQDLSLQGELRAQAFSLQWFLLLRCQLDTWLRSSAASLIHGSGARLLARCMAALRQPSQLSSQPRPRAQLQSICSSQMFAKKSMGLGRVGFYFSKGGPKNISSSSFALGNHRILQAWRLPGLLAGWLAGWLVVLAGWLAGWLPGLACWLAGWLPCSHTLDTRRGRQIFIYSFPN